MKTKTVEVSVFWRWEAYKKMEVPVDMELIDVRDMVVWDNDFDAATSDLTEFEVFLIEDEEGNEWAL